MLKTSIAAFALALLAATVTAQEAGEVSSTLTVSRIVVGQDGKETREPALEAKPGETLEYVAVYRNTGKGRARNLEATLPIPPGTQYVPQSAQPGAVRASLDGAKYEPVPLKRKVRQADGAEKEELVPYAEYRYLRWSPRDLAAGRSARFSARVQVLNGGVQPAVGTR